jgi:hypothetical protein
MRRSISVLLLAFVCGLGTAGKLWSQASELVAVRAGRLFDFSGGWSDPIGSLEKGKFADLIALEGGPLRDISELRRVKFVMKVGQIVRGDLAK